MNDRWRTVWQAAWSAPLLCLAAACASTPGGSRPAVPGPAPAPITLDRPPALVVEAVVTDKKGVPAQDLRVTDFEVTVDGTRRTGLALGRLYRGPGAEFAAASRAPGPGEVLPLSEPSRVILIAVDQGSLSPGDERAARALGESCLGLLGLSDRVAVLTLPPTSGTTVVNFDRVDAGKQLAALRPMWDRQAATADAGTPGGPPGAAVDPAVAGEPGRGARGAERTQGDAARGEPPGRDTDRGAAVVPGTEVLPPELLKAHASTTLAALRQIARALASAPGAKTILFLSAGLVVESTQAPQVDELAAEAARAHTRLVAIQVPSTSALREVGGAHLQQLAERTGGRLIVPANRPQQAMERLATELAFSYLLMLAPMPGDGDPVPHPVTVTLPRRKDLVVQVPRRVLPWRIPPDHLAAALSPRAQAQAEAQAAKAAAPPTREMPPGVRPTGFAAFQHDSSVDLVLARVSQYAWDYGRELSSIVSEETYKQEVRGKVDPKALAAGGIDMAARERTLLSDYLLVKVPGMEGWLPFRDVFQVDGKQVRDREDRLVKLFIEAPSPAVAVERGNQVLRESARYNIGPVIRTLNVPTLPLWFVEPKNVRRFAFRKADEVKLAGRPAWVLEFTERVRPTFVKTVTGADVPVQGRLWVDPLNGQILQTRVGVVNLASITVKYGQHLEIPGIWLPDSMEEHYLAGTSEVRAMATYARYRRFQVVTSERVALPKK